MQTISALSLPGDAAAGSRLARTYRWALRAGVLLALTVIVLGATVRLSDAGLSCPDWPGCYGQISVGAAAARPDFVRENWPSRPLDPGRAHLEMTHRYAAGGLVAVILVVGLCAWLRGRGRRAAAALLALVALQALLGMWTVTLGLKPIVVVAHLVGGLATLGLLWWLALEDGDWARIRVDGVSRGRAARWAPRLRGLALVGLAVLSMQIVLGGWTSSNHAALACRGFPTCNGAWWPDADFAAAFRPTLGGALDGADVADIPTGRALIAIQWTHRLGALAVVLILGGLVLASGRLTRAIRPAAGAVGLLLLTQIGLGILNVLVGRPLLLAIAHNAVAALLLLALIALLHQLGGLRRTAGGVT